MDHIMVLSYDYAKQKRRRRWTNTPLMQAISMAVWMCWSSSCGIAQCSMTRASPEATGCRHWATTCSILPRRPPGWQQMKRQCNMYPLCWPYRWPWQCGSMIPCTSTNGGESWLSQKQLNDPMEWALALIIQNQTRQRQLFLRFHVKKGSSWHVGP